jgi:hypothetical protein
MIILIAMPDFWPAEMSFANTAVPLFMEHKKWNIVLTSIVKFHEF